MYKPNASISFFYICETEEEMNRIWNAFQEKGSVLMPLDRYEWSEKYGWINDVYGISWQLSLGGIESVGQRLSPCLLFTGERYGQAEAAMQYYATVFKDHKLDGILRYEGQETPDQEGKIKHAQIAFLGQKFMFMESAHNHSFTFSEGVSLIIHCDTQEEIDFYWDKLTAGGQESMCGWLKDQFGLCWQIIPTVLARIMSDPNKAGKAAKAFMQMRKLDIERIVQASLA